MEIKKNDSNENCDFLIYDELDFLLGGEVMEEVKNSFHKQDHVKNGGNPFFI